MISLEFFLSDPGKTQLLVVENFAHYPKRTFFFIKPGKVFRALQGYFLTMLGKGISSHRRGPGNLAEDSGLGNSNRPASPHPPGKKKKKASVAILRWSCCEEDMCCSSNKGIFMMSKLANNVLNAVVGKVTSFVNG